MSEGEVYDEEAQRAVEAICKERDELKARVEYLRDVLIAMVNEHTGKGISEDELKGHSDEVLCAEAALSFRVAQIAMMVSKKRADKLEKNQFTRDELDLIRNAFQDQIRDDKDGWSAEKKIIAKCNELLKERKDK